MKRYLNLVETAKAIKQTLKTAFPATRFTVRSDRYSGGASINVNWTDGPSDNQVKPILDAFSGAGFDGSQDLKYYKGDSTYKGEIVNFGVDFVNGTRRYSLLMYQTAVDIVCMNLDIHEAIVAPPTDYLSARLTNDIFITGENEWLSSLVYQCLSMISKERTCEVEIPERVSELTEA